MDKTLQPLSTSTQVEQPYIPTVGERHVMNVLAQGELYSAADLSTITGYCDPRSIIRNLRGAGVGILDRWTVGSAFAGRHKLYF